MTDYFSLWQAIEESNGDMATMLVFSDWLEENGKEPDLAYALRWAARWGLFPHATPKRKKFSWTRAIVKKKTNKASSLPGVIFDHVSRTGNGQSVRHYSSALEAMIALGWALKRLRDAIALEPQK